MPGSSLRFGELRKIHSLFQFKGFEKTGSINIMDHKDIRTLKILEEMENDHAPSQRYLARKLNISLGLVNAFIKRLAQKGYCKITTVPKSRVRYILTPKGVAEKARLTYDFVQFSFQFYKKTRGKLSGIFCDLEAEKGDRVIFYGATELAEIGYVSLQGTNINLVAVVDGEKIGDKFLGFTIKDPITINDLFFDRIIVTAMGPKDAVMKNILDNGVQPDKIALLD